MELPKTETLLLGFAAGALHITLNRPAQRNAMNARMLDELLQVLPWANRQPAVRAVVLRGSGGTFCAGADLKDLAAARPGAEAAGQPAPEPSAVAALAAHNRRFGAVAQAAGALGVPLVGVLEGAVLGGGFGLACVTDIALCLPDTRFGLPETRLGILPAQIAPFVLQRIGLTQARRLMLTGARIDGQAALDLGLVHQLCADPAVLQQRLTAVLDDIRACAPAANRQTKAMLLQLSQAALPALDAWLDRSAEHFARASLGPEGREGTRAFVERRKPEWNA